MKFWENNAAEERKLQLSAKFHKLFIKNMWLFLFLKSFEIVLEMTQQTTKNKQKKLIREKFGKEMTALLVLYGEKMSKEELFRVLNHYDGDVSKAIDYILSHFIHLQFKSTINVDPLYANRLSEIDSINDRDRKYV